MRENLLYWTRDDYSLLRHVLTSVLKNLDIRLFLWRRPNDNESAPMTPKQATIKLIEIALPDRVEYEREFDPSRYYHSLYHKIRRINEIYFMKLYPESIDQLMRSNDYKLIDIESVWELLRELGGASPKKDENRMVAKPPGGLVKNPNGDSAEENRGKVVTLPEVGSNGSGSGSSIRTKTSNNLRPTKSSVNLEPGPVKLGNLDTITPSVELPSSSISTAVWGKKPPTPDSEDQDGLEERKLEKARKHELAVINAKVRLVEAQTELVRVRGNFQKK